MNKLKNKVALITGGAQGIGKGIAKAFVKESAVVVIIDIDQKTGSKTIEELNKINNSSNSIFIQADLSEHQKLSTFVEKVVKKYGKLDILVNNAHASNNVAFDKVSQQDFDLSFDTGFYPTFYLMQAALPYLKESEGTIINFASGAGINGDKNQATYAAAKEAIRAISRVAANEFGEFGINVNLISPVAKTPGVEKWAEENPDYYKSMLSNIPLGRLGDPEADIGKAAVFLASEDANYISGQTIMVDGGTTKLR